MDLSIPHRRHVFHTLNHATALRHGGAEPVTVAKAYFEKGFAEGGIVPSGELSPPG